MDAPGHFIQGGRFVPQLKPAELVLPIVVIDITSKARRNPDAEVTAADLRAFERRHGRIPRGALVAMNSGWAAKLGTPAFTGRDSAGVYHFPGFAADTVEYLIDRRAMAIGVDTLSLDNGPSTTFAVHTNWLKADKYGLENLAGLDKIPEQRRDGDGRRDPVGAGLGRAGAGVRHVLSRPASGRARPVRFRQKLVVRRPRARLGSPRGCGELLAAG